MSINRTSLTADDSGRVEVEGQCRESQVIEAFLYVSLFHCSIDILGIC